MHWHRVDQRLLQAPRPLRPSPDGWKGHRCTSALRRRPSGAWGSTSIRCSPASGSGRRELCLFLGGKARAMSPWSRRVSAMQSALIPQGDDPGRRPAHLPSNVCRHRTRNCGRRSPSRTLSPDDFPVFLSLPDCARPALIRLRSEGRPDRTVGRAEPHRHDRVTTRGPLSAASRAMVIDYRPMDGRCDPRRGRLDRSATG